MHERSMWPWPIIDNAFCVTKKKEVCVLCAFTYSLVRIGEEKDGEKKPRLIEK